MSVRPVLCLTGERSGQFGEPQQLADVTVLPVERLVAWLRALPQVMTAERAASLAVELSCAHPPAVNPGMTLAAMAAAPAPRGVEDAPARRPTPAGRSRHARRPIRPALAKALVATVMLALAIGIGAVLMHLPSLLTSAVRAQSSPSPTSTLSAAQLQSLDDWRIRAGRYEANEQPYALPNVPDAGLGAWSHQCGTQRKALARFRPVLLNAPDLQLRVDAARYDTAAGAQLTACIRNDAVGLHHARAAMNTAATSVNARYDSLIGVDPTSVYAKHVL